MDDMGRVNTMSNDRSSGARVPGACAPVAWALLACVGGCALLERPEFGRDCTERACEGEYTCFEERCVPFGFGRTEPLTGATWVLMPSGTFHYGCEPQDTECESEERPGRTEQVDGFWMMQTEVTVDANERCKAAGVCLNGSVTAPSRPVTRVTWTEAATFCEWLGGRLPTAVEWEYAAKSGSSRVFPWGDEQPDETRANCDRCGDTFDRTSSVGSFPAGDTRWGLKDMAGNVWEWTDSRNDSNTVEIRGGSWTTPTRYLRASSRANVPPNDRGETGVRCAQSVKVDPET